MHLQHAAAQHWQAQNNGYQHGASGYANGHSSWPAQQNGGMNGANNRLFWHEGQALQMVQPGAWDPSNHPLSELLPTNIHADALHMTSSFPVVPYDLLDRAQISSRYQQSLWVQET